MEAAIGTDQHIVAELHPGAVEYHQIVIGKKVIADLDIIAVVAVERRNDRAILADLAAELFEQLALFFRFLRAQHIIVAAKILRVKAFLFQLLVTVRKVKHTLEHFLFFCHIILQSIS